MQVAVVNELLLGLPDTMTFLYVCVRMFSQDYTNLACNDNTDTSRC